MKVFDQLSGQSETKTENTLRDLACYKGDLNIRIHWVLWVPGWAEEQVGQKEGEVKEIEKHKMEEKKSKLKPLSSNCHLWWSKSEIVLNILIALTKEFYKEAICVSEFLLEAFSFQ